MSEPTSALTFSDLILEVAYKLGTAFYGSDGTGVPQVPTDAHDLFVCKKIVNDAIRMFIHDAPKPNGWKWLRPVADVIVWGTQDFLSTNTVSAASYDAGTGLTTITISNTTTTRFYPSMEYRVIQFNSVTPVAFLIQQYVSSTQVKVQGDAHLQSGQRWKVQASGDYTLPNDFGGQHLGEATFAAGTNRGVTLHWVGESLVRERRANVTQETGTPYQIAVRRMQVNGSDYSLQLNMPVPATINVPSRPRWELMCYRMPGEILHIQFPYMLHFDSLVNLTDVHPAPFSHDESIKAACLAVAEKKVLDSIDGPDWTYYRRDCLPNSYSVDANAGPRALGYFGNPSAAQSAYPPIKEFRDNWYQRPSVPFNS